MQKFQGEEDQAVVQLEATVVPAKAATKGETNQPKSYRVLHGG